MKILRNRFSDCHVVPLIVFIGLFYAINYSEAARRRQPKNNSRAHTEDPFDPKFILTTEQETWLTEGLDPVRSFSETLVLDDPAEKLISVPGCPK
jgi:hypothetical protein